MLPTIFDLGNFGHVSHVASCVEIRKDCRLTAMTENVGAFGHKMHAAKDDVLPARLCSLLRELVGVAAKIGESDDFIALIVVTEDYTFPPQNFACGRNAIVHGVVGQDEIIF